jgi:hypothetical protein
MPLPGTSSSAPNPPPDHPNHISGELGEVIFGRKPARNRADETIVFDSTGDRPARRRRQAFWREDLY